PHRSPPSRPPEPSTDAWLIFWSIAYMSASSTASSFHFSPPTFPASATSPLYSPISPLDPHEIGSHSPPLSSPHHPFVDDDTPSPLFYPSTSRPPLLGRANSYVTSSLPAHNNSLLEKDDASIARQRRVSYAGHSFAPTQYREDNTLTGGGWGESGARSSRTVSESLLPDRASIPRALGTGGGSLNGGGANRDTHAFEPAQDRFVQQVRPSLLPLPPSFSSPHSFSQPIPSEPAPPKMPQLQEEAQNAQLNASDPRAGASLHLGDLDIWMDEAYVRECCARMGWEGVTSIKMIRGSGTTPTSGYCFLTYPDVTRAAQVLARFNTSPPTLMPRSSRTFKLNWGTGLPGLQPNWQGEYSVFVGELAREVGEAELISLFTPLFPSTKSAKIMYDPSTFLSRGYGFVRFADKSEMQRALMLGQNSISGLSLHGRTLRISEASGPGNDSIGYEHGNGYYPYPPQQHDDVSSPDSSHGEYVSPTFPVPYTTTPRSPSGGQFIGGLLNAPSFGVGNGPLSPGLGSQGGSGVSSGGRSSSTSHTTDPNNTTVFVGGLPVCISEETLKSFFHHFGEIAYCKIPTGKGCGFVQFVRRADAELAIAKMNDFPIHGKSRIRLSWGRSQSDKQVEHVRKLASALGVPFDGVWRMVQGQDNTTIKQIATAVGGSPAVLGTRFENLGIGRLDVGAVATAAGLTEAEVIGLVGGAVRTRDAFTASNGGISPRGDPDFFARSSDHVAQASSNGSGVSSHYSRVSPSAFASAPPPLSPPPFGGLQPRSQNLQHQQAHSAHSYPVYSSVRPDTYIVHPPSSPYERVNFDEGGVTNVARSHYLPPVVYQQYPPGYQPQQMYHQQPGSGYNTQSASHPSQHRHHFEQNLHYDHQQMENSLSHLSFSPPQSAARPHNQQISGLLGHAHSSSTQLHVEYGKGYEDDHHRSKPNVARTPSTPNMNGESAHWGWNDERAF
ncbi:hypothetical protein P7C70_g8651, partial [Phenoliferia sp. Uapishka_3]